ncbi:DUF490 domain-containing protein [Marinobacterium zhoushanense]|uniref:DUF490 domain-containing protein n=1 Tax=Marinobacterium zhoushanense TaxID=1679163 RepID=A0ABQ1K7Q9_9GAMM|nr:translocation/assembly module TamB domain-containing protein [Marinobacterium zhoushanense]GGB86030.1 DUF490 domain-containing protein [Marinobacterium zhoushanense]
MRIKRAARNLLLVLLLLLLLVAALVGWILATESGSRWLVARATAFVPGELSIAQVSGRLIRDLRLGGIEYRSEQLRLIGDSLALDWQPSQLLSGELLVERLALGNIDLYLPAPPAEQESAAAAGPLQLPEQVLLPLAIDIQLLSLQQLRLYVGDVAVPAQQLDSAQLSLSAKEGRLELQQLALRSPLVNLDLAGAATLAGEYPLEFTTKWQLRLPTGTPDSGEQRTARLDGHGRLHGTLNQLDLQQWIEGAADVELSARLESLLSTPQWQVQLELTQLDLKQLLQDPAPELLALQPHVSMQANGGLDTAQLNLVLSATLPELQRTRLSLVAEASAQRIDIRELALQPEQGDARFSAFGQIDDPLGSREIEVRIDWQSLHYPLDQLAPLISSPTGELKLTGTLDDYRVALQTRVSGTDLPPTQLALEGRGSMDGLSLRQLRVDTLGGRIDVGGEVHWLPQVDWDLQVAAEGLQPGLKWPELTGSLNAALKTQGALGEQLEVRLQLDRLDGRLQGQPLNGSGQARIAGSALRLEQLDLSWGEARVQANGDIAEQLALQWQLRVPDLGKLVPGAGGQITGSGRLSGAPALPAVEAELSVSALRYDTTRVEQLEAQLKFDPSWQQPADIRVHVQQIVSAGQAINSADLTVSGTDQQLRIALDADADPTARLRLRADGQLATDLQRDPVYWSWRGRLTQLELSNPRAGRWAMVAPAAVDVDPQRYRLGRLCLASVDVEGTACFAGDGELGTAQPKAQASLNIAGLSLAAFAPFMPEPTAIDGRIDAQAEFSQSGAESRYNALLRLPQAVLSLPDSDLKLTLDGSRIELRGDSESARAQVDIAMDPLQGGIQGQVSVEDLSGAQRLRGEMNARIEQLQPLALLVPALQIHGGSTTAALAMAGTLTQPELNGRVSLSEGDIELPGAGVRISEIVLNLADDPVRAGQMRLEGSALSGQGRLTLNGTLLPMQQRAELNVKGERFEAVNTAEVQLLVSPDLQLALSPQTIRVRGELLIPQALIQAPKLEQSAVSGSPDLVVRSQTGGETSRGPELDVDLRVVLGESVRVDAFGFNGLLNGALNLQQGRGLARGTGSVGVASGKYRLYGQDLEISRGNVIFTGGPLSNPGLDLRVEREVDDVIVGALVGGTLRKPDLTLSSSPAMPDNRILSYLVLGRAPDATSAGEQQLLMKLALSLGAKGGTSITEKLTQSLNVDEIGFASGDTADDTSFYIGKYLSPELYIKYGVGLINPVNTFLMRYQLSKRLSLETQTSAEGSGGDLIYSFESD